MNDQIIKIEPIRVRQSASTQGIVWLVPVLKWGGILLGTVIGYTAITEGPGAVVNGFVAAWNIVVEKGKDVDSMVRSTLKVLYDVSGSGMTAEILRYMSVANQIFGVYTGFSLLAVYGTLYGAMTTLKWFKSLIPGLA